MFKKKDLRDRDVVTYRNGWKRTFIDGKLIDEFGRRAKRINEYDDDLRNTTCRHIHRKQSRYNQSRKTSKI